MAPDLASGDDEAPASTVRVILSVLTVIALVAGSAFAFRSVIIWIKGEHYGFGAVIAAAAVYAAVVLTIVWVWSRSIAAQACFTRSAAAKRYRRQQMIAAVLYVAAILVGLTVRVQLHATGALAYAAALLVAAPVIGMVASMGFYLRDETDEVERAIQMQCALWATGGVLALTAAWGFLEMFALTPHLELWLVFPLWAMLLGASNLFVRRRYR